MRERRSIRELNRAIRREPKNSSLRVERGDHYRERGKMHHANALRDYGDAIRLDPDCAEAYFGRGLVYVREGKYREAIRDYERAVRLNFTLSHADYAEAYHDRGQAYFNKGEYDRAIQDFDKVICLDSGRTVIYPSIYNNKGLAYHQKGEYDLAIENFDAVICIEPDFA